MNFKTLDSELIKEFSEYFCISYELNEVFIAVDFKDKIAEYYHDEAYHNIDFSRACKFLQNQGEFCLSSENGTSEVEFEIIDEYIQIIHWIYDNNTMDEYGKVESAMIDKNYDYTVEW